MAEFSLEIYAPRGDAGGVAATCERARRAAEALAAKGTDVRFVRSVFLPADETCFLLFEAETPEAVEEVGRRALVSFDRVAEAVTESTKA